MRFTIAMFCLGVFLGVSVQAAFTMPRLHCYAEAQYARTAVGFMVYQSELDRCAKLHINIPAIVSPDYHGI